MRPVGDPIPAEVGQMVMVTPPLPRCLGTIFSLLFNCLHLCSFCSKFRLNHRLCPPIWARGDEQSGNGQGTGGSFENFKDHPPLCPFACWLPNFMSLELWGFRVSLARFWCFRVSLRSRFVPRTPPGDPRLIQGLLGQTSRGGRLVLLGEGFFRVRVSLRSTLLGDARLFEGLLGQTSRGCRLVLLGEGFLRVRVLLRPVPAGGIVRANFAGLPFRA